MTEFHLLDVRHGLHLKLFEETLVVRSLVYSPDGEQIALIGHEKSTDAIYLMDARGDAVHKLSYSYSYSPFGALSDLTWSPDGSRIAYLWGEFPERAIVILDMDGTSHQFADDKDISIISFAWSPDGNEMALSALNSVYVMDAEDHNLRLIANLTASPILWSPDGSQIVFGASPINMVNADGSNLHSFTDNTFSSSWSPDWSPSGEQVAFIGLTDSPGNRDIYVANGDGSGLINLTNSNDEYSSLTWSPNGEWIAFTADRGSTAWGYIMEADGSNIRRFNSSSFVGNYTWNPQCP